jgi:hypothetical protein
MRRVSFGACRASSALSLWASETALPPDTRVGLRMDGRIGLSLRETWEMSSAYYRERMRLTPRDRHWFVRNPVGRLAWDMEPHPLAKVTVLLADLGFFPSHLAGVPRQPKPQTVPSDPAWPLDVESQPSDRTYRALLWSGWPPGCRPACGAPEPL